MIERAQAEADRIGHLRNSIRDGAGNLVGCIGEQAFLELFPGAVSDNTFQHDIRMDDITIECKTKDRTVSPRLDYEASVANANTSQQAEYYVFMSVLRDSATNRYIRAYFCGIISKKEYFEKATFLEAGTVDPSNGWRVKASCWNLPYRELDR